jgi:hypothetical protein
MEAEDRFKDGKKADVMLFLVTGRSGSAGLATAPTENLRSCAPSGGMPCTLQASFSSQTTHCPAATVDAVSGPDSFSGAAE